jgi:TPR repeat protein
MADETTRELLRAAERGDAEAQLQIGYRYGHEAWHDDVAEEAVKWLERAARQGHAGAQWELAVQCCPEFDSDVAPLRDDPAMTLKWMRAAAEQGHADAIGRMAEIYERGLAGVVPDFDEATKWLLIGGTQCGLFSASTAGTPHAARLPHFSRERILPAGRGAERCGRRA